MSVQGLSDLVRLRSEVVAIQAERALIHRFLDAVDAWAHPAPQEPVAEYQCDWCDAPATHTTADGIELCPACFSDVVSAAQFVPPMPEAAPTPARFACICGKERRWVDKAGVEQIAPSFPMQVYYTDRYNENRSGQIVNEDGTTTAAEDARTVPDWVRFEAMKVELACPAKHHLVEVLTTEWYGNDVVTSEDEGRANMHARAEEDAALHRSLHDPALERFGGEYESYESQDEFVRRLTDQRRVMLFRLLKSVGAVPNAPETKQWIKDVVEDTTVVKNARGRVIKNGAHGNLLRGYSRCIWLLKQRIEDGTLTLR